MYPSLTELNQAWSSEYGDWCEIRFTRRPVKGREASDRLGFVRHGMPVSFLRFRGDAYVPAYRDFLRIRYADDLAACNRSHETTWLSFDAIPAQDRAPLSPVGAKRDWLSFFEHEADSTWVDAETSADDYVRFLNTRYASVEALNAAHGTSFASLGEARPPLALYDAWCVELRSARLRWYLLTMNYRTVFRFLVTRGQAGINTVVLLSFCRASPTA